VPVQHIGLWRSVVQNPTQHRIAKRQSLPDGSNQPPQAMQHETGCPQPHRHAVNVFSRHALEQQSAAFQSQTAALQYLPHRRCDRQGVGIPVFGYRNRQDALVEVNLLAR